MKLFITYCVILLIGCAHFNTEKRNDDLASIAELPKSDTLNVVNEVAMVSYSEDILPILKTRCQPCHFPGGKMHLRLPFDSVETIYEVGDGFFTRIKDPEEQEVFRAFLDQESK
ncbi:MAG: hypothetical protein ABJH05_08335 [Fulvivirga sp.]